jgi:hypothetical protein
VPREQRTTPAKDDASDDRDKLRAIATAIHQALQAGVPESKVIEAMLLGWQTTSKNRMRIKVMP